MLYSLDVNNYYNNITYYEQSDGTEFNYYTRVIFLVFLFSYKYHYTIYIIIYIFIIYIYFDKK
jgi:hypothetical protein